jgi:hypothetical protein
MILGNGFKKKLQKILGKIHILAKLARHMHGHHATCSGAMVVLGLCQVFPNRYSAKFRIFTHPVFPAPMEEFQRNYLPSMFEKTLDKHHLLSRQ